MLGNVGEIIEYWEEPVRKMERKAQAELAGIYHYHGFAVRRIFLAGGFTMLFGLPFFYHLIPHPFYFSVLAVFILVLSAGVTNPHKVSSIILDVLVSLGAVAVFENYAIYAYATLPAEWLFFWINQFLTIIFLFALYFSAKTLRGMIFD